MIRNLIIIFLGLRYYNFKVTAESSALICCDLHSNIKHIISCYSLITCELKYKILKLN